MSYFKTVIFFLIFGLGLAENEYGIFNLVVLGNAGSGKSAFLNMLAGNITHTLFKINHKKNMITETQITNFKVVHAMGNKELVKLRLIDTQGLPDGQSDEINSDHTKNMIEAIREFGYVNLFVLCLEGQSSKLTSYMNSTITLFKNEFPDFVRASVVVFNKWESADQELMNNVRKINQEIFRNYDKYRINQDMNDIQIYFINSYFNLNSDDMMPNIKELHPEVKSVTKKQINAFLKKIDDKKRIQCYVRVIKPDLKKKRKKLYEEVKEHCFLTITKSDKMEIAFDSLSGSSQTLEEERKKLEEMEKKYALDDENFEKIKEL